MPETASLFQNLFDPPDSPTTDQAQIDLTQLFSVSVFSNLVHDLQTSFHRPLPPFFSEGRKSQFWAILGLLTTRMAEDDDVRRHKRRLFRCFNDFMIWYDSTNRVTYLSPTRCNLFFCPLCCRSRQQRVAKRFEHQIRQMKNPMLWTFTLKSQDVDLSTSHTRIVSAFAALRKQPFFKQSVKGGIWVFEFTYNTLMRQWHPHLHAVIDTPFLSHQEVASFWYAETKDSFIVQYQDHVSSRKSAEYLSSYISKPPELGTIHADKLLEWIQTIKGKRMYGTFGHVHKMPKIPPEQPKVPDTAEFIGFFSTMTYKHIEWKDRIAIEKSIDWLICRFDTDFKPLGSVTLLPLPP